MAAGYNIYRGIGSRDNIDYDTPVATCGAVAEYGFTQSDLSADTEYFYAIRAQNSNDTEDVNTDVYYSFKTDANGDFILRPNSPILLTATRKADGKIKLDWQYREDDEQVSPDEFVIYYGTDEVDYTYANRLASVAGTVYTFTTNSLTSGQKYQFSVRARSSDDYEDLNSETVIMQVIDTNPVAVTSPSASVGF